MELLLRLPHLDKIDKDEVSTEERTEAKAIALERSKPITLGAAETEVAA